MEAKIIGRVSEFERLEKAWMSGSFEFIVIYGRRRVGKSFLIDAFAESHKGIYFEAVDGGSEISQIRLMSRAVSGALHGSADLVYPDFIAILDDIARAAEKERIFFAIDEISYLCEACPQMPGLLQYYVDTVFRKTKLVLILSGSFRRFIEEDILSRESPLYGRSTVHMKILPFTAKETAAMLPSWDINGIAIAHVITGGIPYYLNFLAKHSTVMEAIEEEFFQPGGSLFTEAELFMRGLYRNIGTYDAILCQLASGTNEVGKIAGKTGLSEANVSAALSSLASQDIVQRKAKIAGKGNGRGWEIVDGYFAFYHRYVQPYRSLIERWRGQGAYAKAVSSIDGFVAKRMEAVFREYVLDTSTLLITSIGSIDFANPVLKRNEEVDLFGQCDEGWVIGECKWQNSPVGQEVLSILEMRKALLVGDDTAYYYLLSKSGFDEDLIRLTSPRDDIHLVTAEEVFGR